MRIGTWCEIPTPYVTHIIAKAGLDFIILDMEHGIIDFETIQYMVFAAHSEGCKAYIRVPAIEEAYILRALDTGADGIVFPQVSSMEDVDKIVRYSKYKPDGERGFNPYISAGGYTGVDSSYFVRENARTELAIILEGKQAFDNIESILQNDNINIVYIGQYDLSMALGVPGDVNNQLVLDAMEKAVIKIREHSKQAGCMVHSVVEAETVAKKGFDFIVYKVDTGVLYQAFNDFARRVKK